ncbi:hypothetical protein [Kineococcus arenarius]|uniref:hypothetical protein n=1 Tax=unclassified Kineococcus TaxID=2621656 RepID=UPI003D7C3F96
MSRGYIPQRDEDGNENWDVMRLDLDFHVPNEVLDDAPSRQASVPRRYADYRGLEGRDIIDFLLERGVSVGAHDLATAEALARDLDLTTVLTLLSWVRRASADETT